MQVVGYQHDGFPMFSAYLRLASLSRFYDNPVLVLPNPIHDPPHEQWLTGLGADAGSCCHVWRGIHPSHPPLTCCPLPFVLGGDMAVSTCNSPCEQWLAGLGVGAGGCCSVVLSTSVVLLEQY
jgi:hypothetical protein